MDRQLEKELDDLISMRQTSRLYPQIVLAEKIGVAQLIKLHHKPSLIDRLRRIDRRLK